jgi:hypothetical protein
MVAGVTHSIEYANHLQWKSLEVSLPLWIKADCIANRIADRIADRIANRRTLTL